MQQFLKGIEPGFYLMADGYQGYNKVKETPSLLLLGSYPQIPLGSHSKGTRKGLQQSCSTGSSLLQ